MRLTYARAKALFTALGADDPRLWLPAKPRRGVRRSRAFCS